MREMRDRAEAQRRANRIRAFQAELAALKAEGVSPLSAEQEAALAAHHEEILGHLATEYDVDRSDRAGQLSRGMRLLSLFGAATLTAAIYSIVARFWGRLEPVPQAALLSAGIVAALSGVELSARRERTLYVASLFALAAYGTFWVAVSALSASLDIPVTPPFIWAGVLFGIGLAIPYRFRSVLAVALGALALAVAASFFQASGVEWTLAFERLELLTIAGFSLLVLSIPLAQIDPAFPTVTRLVGVGIGLGGLLVLSTSGSTSLLPVAAKIAEGIYQALMLVACVLAIAVGLRRSWNETVNLASALLAIFLLVRFVDWFWDLLPRYVFFLILAALAFVTLIVLRRVRGRVWRSYKLQVDGAKLRS